MEQFRFDNSVSVSDRSYLRAGRRPVRDTRTETSARVKTGTILDDDEGSSQYYYFNDRRPWKSHLSFGDRDLYICRDRHAIIQ